MMGAASIRAFSTKVDAPGTGAWSGCASGPRASACGWRFGAAKGQAPKSRSLPRRPSPMRTHRVARAQGCGVASPIGILSVDDHRLLREGIAALVNSQPDMRLIAEAANGREAIEQFRMHRPDVTLMDLQMPELDGIDAMIAIRGE